ncbi:MAG: redoxin domain-containing protein [bacterium]|nr:redoxin domain-containing protein [bacterium]MDZ4299570.1 redoxin domain-containing protein [Candidatus Sungbacteria bacterium]
MSRTHIILLIIALVVISIAILLIERRKPMSTTAGSAEIPFKTLSTAQIDGEQGKSQHETAAQIQAIVEKKAATYPRAKEIVNPSGFINAPDSLHIADLIGKKIILVDFWTYSCINCQRTLPYLNEWYKKYRAAGLEIVSIHTPEFDFEKDRANVVSAVKKYGIEYPVVQDNDYATWSAYQNLYWPHKYLIDTDGFIVYDHIGEGSYEETEQKIQELLVELHVRLGAKEMPVPAITTPAAAIDVAFDKVGSHETYFGSARNEFLANGERKKSGTQVLTLPDQTVLNALTLGGTWDFSPEFAENKTANARIVYRYHAKRVYLVASGGAGVELEILRDGKLLGKAAGKDIREAGGISRVTIRESRLYELISDPDGYGTHTLEIIMKQPGLKAFAFTFG